jgi:methylmalonyl-CoA mutase, C-terminal domain
VSSSDHGRTTPPRVVLAKPGMDGHNRGVRVVSRILRDAGCEVIYLGIRRTPEEIAAVAVSEDADIVGLSLLSGAHIKLCAATRAALDEVGLQSTPIICGGIIPAEDHEVLLRESVAAVFTPGATAQDIRKVVFDLSNHDDAVIASGPREGQL